MNNSMTHSRFTRFITGWISFFNESLEWMIQWLTQDSLVSLLDESVFLMNLLNEWFNDSLKIHLFHYWMNQFFEWISWMNDSMTHSRFTCFITGWISFLNESLEWMIQWLTQDSLVSLLDESVFWMNLLNEWFNDSLKIHLFHYWMNQFSEWISWMNDSMTHSRFTCFITGWISFLNESLEWMIQRQIHF